MVNLGEVFPNFIANTTSGEIQLHDWLGDSWGLLFSHPADYTPVCLTELSRGAQLVTELNKRNVKMIALSCNDINSHNEWIKDIQAYSNLNGLFPYPIISDEKRELAVLLGMIDPVEKDKNGLPLTCRAIFIIGPDKKLKLSMLYPATTGRNFDELLRVIDSMQLTAEKLVATPADWKPGCDCVILPTIQPENIPDLFPKGVRTHSLPSNRDYLRFTPQP